MQSQHCPVDPRCQSRLSSGREGQPADAPCRHQELFRNGAIGRGRAGRDGRQGPRPLRGPHHTVSHVVDWYAAQRSYPGAPRFPQLTTIAMVESRIKRGDKIETEQRSYISSRALSAAAFADGARGHWGIENNLHWTLDVTFNEDQSRLRAGHGAKNMAVVRHFALNLVRQAADNRSIKRRRKRAAWDPKYLLEILGPLRC